MIQEFINTKQAAALTGLSKAWFEWKRWQGGDQPPYLRVGRGILYERERLIEWFRARQVTPGEGA